MLVESSTGGSSVWAGLPRFGFIVPAIPGDHTTNKIRDKWLTLSVNNRSLGVRQFRLVTRKAGRQIPGGVVPFRVRLGQHSDPEE